MGMVRNMSALQIKSASRPYDDPRVAPLAASALSRAEAMGLWPAAVFHLDSAVMEALDVRLAEAGIARSVRRPVGSDPAETAGWLRALHEALAGSPVPASEWQSLSRSLGLDLTAGFVAVSRSSARRYASGERATPDAVAARLHFLALVVGDLAGAYSDIGVRRWFERRRTALGGRTPADLLRGAWTPDDKDPERVRKLAAGLAFSPAT